MTTRQGLRASLASKAPPAPAPAPSDPAEALARAAAVRTRAEAREALRDRPHFDQRGRPVPRYYLLEAYRTGAPAGWWRDVGLAPLSLRDRIRREPDAWVVVELVGRVGPPFAFRLSDLEAE